MSGAAIRRCTTHGAGDGWVEPPARRWTSVIRACRPTAWSRRRTSSQRFAARADAVVARTVPRMLRRTLGDPPLALSQTRIAGNVTLPVGFSLRHRHHDRLAPDGGGGPAQVPTVRGIEKPACRTARPASTIQAGTPARESIYRPRIAAAEVPGGLWAGFALYRGRQTLRRTRQLLAGCGADRPGIRARQEDRRGGLSVPTIVPLTDEEIGSAPVEGGRFLPWDGVRGPGARRPSTAGGWWRTRTRPAPITSTSSAR